MDAERLAKLENDLAAARAATDQERVRADAAVAEASRLRTTLGYANAACDRAHASCRITTKARDEHFRCLEGVFQILDTFTDPREAVAQCRSWRGLDFSGDPSRPIRQDVKCHICRAGAPALQTRKVDGKQVPVCPFCILRLDLQR